MPLGTYCRNYVVNIVNKDTKQITFEKSRRQYLVILETSAIFKCWVMRLPSLILIHNRLYVYIYIFQNHINEITVITVKFSRLLFIFNLWVLLYGNRWHSRRSRKFILVTMEIRLFHLLVLLTSLNICSDRAEEFFEEFFNQI